MLDSCGEQAGCFTTLLDFVQGRRRRRRHQEYSLVSDIFWTSPKRSLVGRDHPLNGKQLSRKLQYVVKARPNAEDYDDDIQSVSTDASMKYSCRSRSQSFTHSPTVSDEVSSKVVTFREAVDLIEYDSADKMEGLAKQSQKVVPLREYARNTRPVKRSVRRQYQARTTRRSSSLKGNRRSRLDMTTVMNSMLRPANSLELTALRRDRARVLTTIEEKVYGVVN
ncbi:hypothetical protein Pmar_PMAR020610 [Perkinsus marinus ATCC 50983]|uniref:Uncharacterized protein n=1 Tax=Perkinsus marinus (strain ATCC 50983 / TXsc) TaxID=423536 RepID=C5L7I6_PERM5|nr:hypothetical protein Pmar_PMAR020610 [Perkinsus marinus ATCC 50983]EER07448.1 hypothetical protein Pmar_PMAR020610 [Perkinsus marinus ATCC 50983]|eukprot:XP_002775632.1 hypothetical protein Pmar_PMAR020610 [Perkinsus marinus ATCC 50983]